MLHAKSNQGTEQRKPEESMANTRQSGAARMQAGDRWRGNLRRTWIWIERLLLVSGLVLVAIYGAARIESRLQSKAVVERFESSIESRSAEPATHATQSVEAELEIAEPDFSGWSKQRIASYLSDRLGQSRQALAVLEIPKIGLKAPVLEGTDDLTLNDAVGRIAGTAQPGEEGNIGLAGHRDGFFRKLKDLNVGDQIYLKTRTGRSVYLVDQIQIVNPTNVSVLKKGPKPSVTLVTCYPFYFIGSAPERYIVTASLEREVAKDRALDLRPALQNQKTKGELP